MTAQIEAVDFLAFDNSYARLPDQFLRRFRPLPGEADLFRQYATEALHRSSKAVSENEKRNLVDFACNLVASSVDG